MPKDDNSTALGVDHPPHFVGADQLRQFVNQIENTEMEIERLQIDKSEFYKAAGQAGFDVGALKAVLRERRRKRRNLLLFQTQAEMIALYLFHLEAAEGP
jgi:uncharacterized protein (UPF0335 family)